MSLIPALTTLRAEDFDPEQRKWIGKLLFPLNQFLLAATSSINGNITLGDNIPCQTQVLNFVYGGAGDFPKRFLWKQTDKPVEIRVAQALEDSSGVAVVIAWTFSGSQVSINSMVKLTSSGVSALSEGSTYIITLRGQP